VSLKRKGKIRKGFFQHRDVHDDDDDSKQAFFSSAAVAFSSKWLKSIQRERVFSFAQTIAAAMTTMLKT